MYRIILPLICTLIASYANASSILEKSKNDDVAFIEKENPHMLKAFKKAQATLDNFLKTSNSPPTGTRAFSVKIAITDKHGSEYFWISKFKYNNKEFTGILDNTPRIVRTVSRGQEIKFKKKQIVDWTYMKNNRMMGNYTACALLTKETKANAERFKKAYGLRCD